MVPFLSFGISLPFIMDYEYNPTANWIWRISNRLQVFLEDAVGHSRAEKAKTHERIAALASKRFREKGLEGIGIAELMKPTGLTVGGFLQALRLP
jgi:hypothetical protein